MLNVDLQTEEVREGGREGHTEERMREERKREGEAEQLTMNNKLQSKGTNCSGVPRDKLDRL